MIERLEQIYRLTELPILTLQNLVGNIKLDNYNEVKYYKEDGKIICQMSFDNEGKKCTAVYEFYNDRLELVKIESEGNQTEIFNREKELENLFTK